MIIMKIISKLSWYWSIKIHDWPSLLSPVQHKPPLALLPFNYFFYFFFHISIIIISSHGNWETLWNYEHQIIYSIYSWPQLSQLQCMDRALKETHCRGFGVSNHLDEPNNKAMNFSYKVEWNQIDSIMKIWIYGTISQSLLHTSLKKTKVLDM